jgi:hypothetical protein
VFSLSFVLIVAGLAFGGITALVGFGGFLTAWFHRSLGTPLPLPTLHNAHEKHIYLGVAAAGFLMWGVTLLISLKVAP